MTTKEIMAQATKFNATKIRLATVFATDHDNVRVRRNAMRLIIHGEVSHRTDPFHMSNDDREIREVLATISDYHEYTNHDTFTYFIDTTLNLGNEALYA